MTARSSALNVVAFAVAAAMAAACSLLISFDPAGQPCDTQGRCLSGYACVNRACQPVDGGVDACGCSPDQRCLQTTPPRCVTDTCDNRQCAVGYACTESATGTACTPISAPNLGHPCSEDTQCGASRYCYKGAIAATGTAGLPRTGICVEKCVSGSCATQGATCLQPTMSVGGDKAAFCVPPRTVMTCKTDTECASEGFVCTVFDNPAIGPATLCDAPAGGGVAIGAACSATGTGDAGLCGNGLCIPRQPAPGTPTHCAQLCDGINCPAGSQCALTELSVSGNVRMLPTCLKPSELTACRSCASSATVCGPDAPHCTVYSSATVCFSTCTLDAGIPAECASGYTCQVVSGAGARCVPTGGGACP